MLPQAHKWTANELDEACQGFAWDCRSPADRLSAQSADSQLELSLPAIHAFRHDHVQAGSSATEHALLTSAACTCQGSSPHNVQTSSTAQVFSTAQVPSSDTGTAPGQMTMNVWQPAILQSAPHSTTDSMTPLASAIEAGTGCNVHCSPAGLPCNWVQHSQERPRPKRRKRQTASSEPAKVHRHVAVECQAAEPSTLPSSAVDCQCAGCQAEGCCVSACLWPQPPQGKQLLCSCSPSLGSTATMSGIADQHLCWGQVHFLCPAAAAAVELAMHDMLACQTLPCLSGRAAFDLMYSFLQSEDHRLDNQNIRGMGRCRFMFALMRARVVLFVLPGEWQSTADNTQPCCSLSPSMRLSTTQLKARNPSSHCFLNILHSTCFDWYLLHQSISHALTSRQELLSLVFAGHLPEGWQPGRCSD